MCAVFKENSTVQLYDLLFTHYWTEGIPEFLKLKFYYNVFKDILCIFQSLALVLLYRRL